MNAARIRSLMDELGLSPNKALGQNFLCDEAALERIAVASGAGKGDHVLEIGPGLGDLTGKLLDRGARVTAVEIDAGLARHLETRFGGREGFSLRHADFLKIHAGGDFSLSVSNLPYYCSSEMLFAMATRYRIPALFAMLQKEMAARIVSQPGSEQYGALAVSLGHYYEVRLLFSVGRTSFYPRPDVTSAFVGMARRADTPDDQAFNDMFHLVVKSAFWGRRKMLLKALSESPHLSAGRDAVREAMRGAGLAEHVRGETLSTEQFRELAAALMGR